MVFGTYFLSGFCFVGGDRVKFGETVTAVALYAVLQVLISFPLSILMIQTMGLLMYSYYSSGLISVFLSMLIVGYLFGERIRKESRKAMTRIIVLGAFYELLVMVFQPTLADWVPFAIDKPKGSFDGTVVTTTEWFLYDLSRRGNMFFSIIIIMGVSLVGLHVGSKLKIRRQTHSSSRKKETTLENTA
jgi:hypothetical protein